MCAFDLSHYSLTLHFSCNRTTIAPLGLTRIPIVDCVPIGFTKSTPVFLFGLLNLERERDSPIKYIRVSLSKGRACIPK